MTVSIGQESGLVGYGIYDNLRPVKESSHQHIRDRREKPKVLLAALHLRISWSAGDTEPGISPLPHKTVSILVMR
jgi:hypothetical protein